ncbi:MAG: chemotaxis protein [Hyphomicrobiales bacterium]|nr:chemotaxis protein [Hyphomicrobiales bacterium]
MSFSLALMIESLVAALLVLTIGYCALLNRRLKRLKGDEQALRGTIAELITATEIAGRAVAGLKAAAQECDGTLGERMRAAERLSIAMARQLKAGELLLAELVRSGIATPAATPATGAPPDPKAMAAAAQALAERARARARPDGLAA